MSKEVKSPQNNSEEIDLGKLFNLFARLFERIFNLISKTISTVFLAFVWSIFFVKRQKIKLILALLAGLAFGYFEENKLNPDYKSTMLIQQNYNTGKSLYNSVDYYNGILSQLDFETLSQELDIDSANVSSIVSFEIEPFVSENQRLVEFKNYTRQLDSTMIAELLSFDSYLDNVDESIYKIQKITISSKTDNNFKPVFNAIAKKMNEIPFFKREQDKDIRQLGNREIAVNKAIQKSDSLQKIYKKVLENSLETIEPTTRSQTSVTTILGADDTNKTREFDLYKSDVELRRELVTIAREKENKKFIVEVLSITPSKGFVDNSIEFFGASLRPVLFFPFFFAVILFVILCFINSLKFLEKYNTSF